MDEHFFKDTLNIELPESFLTNNSREQILYPGTAQSKREPRNHHADLEKGTSRHDRRVGSP